MIKNILNIFIATIILLFTIPVIAISAVVIYLTDYYNPFYLPYRVGKNGKLFKMIKLRSMIPNADLNHVDSTKSNDLRITKIGSIIRRCKIDELPQLLNVIIGDMNIIGPRPNVQREVDIYTSEEMKILNIKPGITDISSIVFSDLGNILRDSDDPNIDYNQLVRPWKSRLCLFYIEFQNNILDIYIFIITLMSFVHRKAALTLICQILRNRNQDEEFIRVCSRKYELVPSITIGAKNIINERRRFNP
jgi:lipopolysaccharide/colanic/teichoic acid biosynthesis glycosyltransferase